MRSVSVDKAWLYEKYRLPYAREAVDDLLRRIGDAPVVADVGAGTGQLARLFAERSETVFVIEPEPAFAPFAALNRQVFAAFAVNDMIQIDYETVVTFGRPFGK